MEKFTVHTGVGVPLRRAMLTPPDHPGGIPQAGHTSRL